MGAERPQSETLRPGLIPHRWTRIDDPATVSVVAAHETVIAGGGPAGLTAAYELSKHGKSCVVLESDRTHGRWHQPHRSLQRISFRYRRTPVLLEKRRGQPALARDSGRRAAHSDPFEPDLLRPQVLPLSAQAGRCALEVGVRAIVPDHSELRESEDRPDQARAER